MTKIIIYLFLFAEIFAETPGSAAKKEVIKFYKTYLQPYGYLNIKPGGFLMGGIHLIDVSCEKQEYVDVDRARCYIVNNIENFLFFINKTKAVKYFDTFPMTELQVFFHINFMTKDNDFIEDNVHISFVIQSKGKIKYGHSHPLGIQNEIIYSETYAEAYEKVYGCPISERLWMKEYSLLK